MKYIIAAHLIVWFVIESIDYYQMVMNNAMKDRPLPDTFERLAGHVESFFWEFTLVPCLLGAIAAGLAYNKNKL